MRVFQIGLSEEEVDIVLKALDAAQTRGVEASRRVVLVFDRIVATVRSQQQAAQPQAKPPEAEPPKPKEN